MSWNAWKTTSASARAGQWYLTWAAGGLTAPRGVEQMLLPQPAHGWTCKPLRQGGVVVTSVQWWGSWVFLLHTSLSKPCCSLFLPTPIKQERQANKNLLLGLSNPL